MLYIIDANNLAGQLGLLEYKDFDTILPVLVSDFFADKQNEIILVFDPRDSLGDRYRENNLEIIYAPRDGFYHNADDKILELIKNHLANAEFKKEIRVVTSDNELRDKIKVAMGESPIGWRVRLIRADNFAAQLEAKIAEESELEEKEVDDPGLNEELLKAWTK
jgi:predicted RNA-binding protein with PIN domain